MQSIPVSLLCAALIFSGQASAQNDVGTAPPLSEYNNVAPGLLMPDTSILPQNQVIDEEGAGNADETMTIEDITTAYRHKQYAQIVPRLTYLAKKGHPAAEELLGVMYHNGQGVEKDMASAIQWLTAAAEAGRPLAQHHLAIINFTGEGIQKDAVKALMWLHIAILHYPEGVEKKQAQADRENIYLQLSRRDKDRARELARDWLDKKGEGLLLDLQ